jgi:hypothetical protein
MLIYFLNSDTGLQSIILGLLCLSFSLITVYSLRRLWPIKGRPKILDIHGHMFGVIGIIYAVLIGAIAIGSWEKFNHADDLIIKEASSAINIYNLAPGLGDGVDKEVRSFIENYLENIIQNEWPKMQKSISPDIKEANVTALTNRLTQINPKNKTQELFVPIVIQEVNNLRMIREERLFLAESSLNTAIFKLVFLGSFLTLLACIFLETESSKLSSVILISILSILIGLVLSAIIGLDHPYQGNLSISLHPLESALTYITSGRE